MRKIYNIVDMTNGGFEIVAAGLTSVESTNQAMTLEVEVGGRFRSVNENITSAAEYQAWQNAAETDPSQGGWAYL